MATVDWLAQVLYEANVRAVAALGLGPTNLGWEDLPETHREMYRRGLTAALEALDDPCLLKLREGEPVFVLRAQDQVAPETIFEWVKRAEHAGMPHGDKRDRALQKMIRFNAWQGDHRTLVKIPD